MRCIDPAPDLTERAAAQEAADARATRLLIRFGAVAIVLLLVWIGVVIATFR